MAESEWDPLSQEDYRQESQQVNENGIACGVAVGCT